MQDVKKTYRLKCLERLTNEIQFTFLSQSILLKIWSDDK